MAKLLQDGQHSIARRTSAAATDLIRAAIVDGRLTPGERLKEGELAGELGISRTPVREALLMLQSEGLVESVPNRGAVVRAYTPGEVEELYELRALLEGFAARRAATRISAAGIRALHASNERFGRLSASDDLAELIRENHVFHNTILEAAGSELLAGMVRNVVEIPLVYKSFHWYPREQKRISEHYHEQLTRALEARDSERAELIMKEHVFEARDFLKARMEQTG